MEETANTFTWRALNPSRFIIDMLFSSALSQDDEARFALPL